MNASDVVRNMLVEIGIDPKYTATILKYGEVMYLQGKREAIHDLRIEVEAARQKACEP